MIHTRRGAGYLIKPAVTGVSRRLSGGSTVTAARPWTLRTRLVVSAVALIAVVAAVIGTVTAIAFQSYMYGKLDDQLRRHRQGGPATRPPGSGKAACRGRRGEPRARQGVRSGSRACPAVRHVQGGPGVGTTGDRRRTRRRAGARSNGADVGRTASRTARRSESDALRQPVRRCPGRRCTRRRRSPALGSYRSIQGVHVCRRASGRAPSSVGIPTAEVDKAVNTLILVEVCVTGGRV